MTRTGTLPVHQRTRSAAEQMDGEWHDSGMHGLLGETITGAEESARAFLAQLESAVPEDQWAMLYAAFTGIFQRCQMGLIDLRRTKHELANLLADEAPTMIEECFELFEICCSTCAWSGTPPPAPAWEPPLRASSFSRSLIAEETNQLAKIPHYSDNLDSGPIASPRGDDWEGPNQKKGPRRDWNAISAKLVPVGRGGSVIWFTIINAAVIFGVFAYMASDYRLWVENHPDVLSQRLRPLEDGSPVPTSSLTLQESSIQRSMNEAVEPVTGLVNVLSWNPEWLDFDYRYLEAWGGRQAAAVKSGNWWLWLTSIYVHQNFQHVLANMLLFFVLAAHLELTYGCWRLTLVWLISGIGGNLISAATENPCVLVVGASGAVFGLQGLFIADVIINFETITRPLLRLLISVVFFIFFVITIVTGPSSVSHWSHVGGLVCGIFPSFLFLPNIKDKRWKAVQNVLTRKATVTGSEAEPEDDAIRVSRQARMNKHKQQADQQLRRSWWTRHFWFNPLSLLAIVFMIGVFVALPIYVYSHRYDDVDTECTLPVVPDLEDPETSTP